MKILVVDDEKTIVKGIKFNLENEGYQVDVCYDGETAVDMARRGEYAVILLDLMMPKLDGLGACQQIRQFSTVPIIMLTARSEDADKLIGFESGADDYITKPFNILELKARIRALIRRSSMAPAAPAEPDGGKLVRGHIEIDPERRSARRFGQNVELTLKEFDLIELLMRNPGKVYSREELHRISAIAARHDARVFDDEIHAPWEAKPMERLAAGVELGKTYPAPVVVHEEARAKTLERFDALKKAR